MTGNKAPEKFVTRLKFIYWLKDKPGREICYLYNREDLNATLNIQKHEYDNSQFIEIGDKLTLEEHACEVVKMNFKLDEQMWDMSGGFGINTLSPSDPTDFNCTINIFVKRLDEQD
jgi:hypothetical protein